MLAFLKPLATIKNILRVIAAAAAAGLIWAAAEFVDAKYKAEAEVTRLEQVVEDQAEANRMMKLRAEQVEEAQAAADAANTELQNLRADYRLIQRSIASAKEEDDGEIAPVLRGALDRLGSMRTE